MTTISTRQPKRNLNILTDIRISKTRIWSENTTYIGAFNSRLSAVLRILSQKGSANLKALCQAILIAKELRRFDVVITGNVKTGQLIAIYKKCFGILKPKQIMLELMLDEARRSLIWKIKRYIQRFIFSSIDVIIVSSSSEVETYSKRFNLTDKTFRFIHFHTNIIEPKLISSNSNFVLSVGRTGRDFHTLIEAARALPMEFIIISDNESVYGIESPKNVRVIIDIPRQGYLKLLQESFFVVVPLKPLVKSTGQVVILEAMACGKPVIASDVVGTRDYIYSGFNGMLVPPSDPDSLRNAIYQVATDLSLQDKFSKNGLCFVLENCTFDLYAGKILRIAHDLV